MIYQGAELFVENKSHYLIQYLDKYSKEVYQDMSQEYINVGAEPNDGTGDPIRDAYIKCNNNFTELYNRAETSPPPSLEGSPGDEPGFYAYDPVYFYYCYGYYDGSSQIWNKISATGNVVVTGISNGTSNVAIKTANSDITFGVNGTGNAMVITQSGIQTANVYVSGYFIGDGGLLSNIAGAYSNANVASYLPTYTGSLTANNATFGNVTVINNINSPTITTTGNITSGNITTGNIAAGNVTASTFIATSALFLNSNTISSNTVIPTGFNGLSAGNIKITSTGNVSVPAGSRWGVV